MSITKRASLPNTFLSEPENRLTSALLASWMDLDGEWHDFRVIKKPLSAHIFLQYLSVFLHLFKCLSSPPSCLPFSPSPLLSLLFSLFIGFPAVGLEDMLMSALVRDQIQGFTSAAIALIPPHKLAVCPHTSSCRFCLHV